MKRIFTLLAIAVAAVTTASALEVTLPAAGTLKEYITPEQQETVTSLKVIGDINGDDLRIIRHMIGAQVSSDNGRYAEVDSGACRVLDLSEANIIGEGFYTFKYVPKPQQGPSYYLPGLQVRKDTIGYAMFCGSKVESLYLPNSVRYIGNTVNFLAAEYFADTDKRDSSNQPLPASYSAGGLPHCIDGSNLRYVKLPAMLRHINIYGQDDVIRQREEGPDYYEVINQCELIASPYLSAVDIDETNAFYKVADGILYTSDLKRLLLCPPKLEAEFKIPEETEVIGFRAFANKMISSPLYLNVKAIEREAFVGASITDKLVLSESVETVGFQAFYQCNVPTLEIRCSPEFECLSKMIVLPSDETKYGGPSGFVVKWDVSFAFARNQSLETILWPTVSVMPPGIFYECPELNELDLRQMPNLDNLGDFTFYNCPLTNLVFDNNRTINLGYRALHRHNTIQARNVFYPSSQLSTIAEVTPDDNIYLWMTPDNIPDIVRIPFSWLDYGVNYISYYDSAYDGYMYRSMRPDEKMGCGYLFVPKGLKERLYDELRALNKNQFDQSLLAFIPYKNWLEIETDAYDYPDYEFIPNPAGVAQIGFGDSVAVEIARYDINGQPLSSPKPGVNLIRYSDGAVKKEINK